MGDIEGDSDALAVPNILSSGRSNDSDLLHPCATARSAGDILGFDLTEAAFADDERDIEQPSASLLVSFGVRSVEPPSTPSRLVAFFFEKTARNFFRRT